MPEDNPQSPEGWAEKSEQFLKVAEVPGNTGIFNVSAADISAQRTQTDTVTTLLTQRDTLQTQLDGVNALLKPEAETLEALVRANLRTAAASKAPNDKKDEAGVTIPKPRVNSAPKVPTDLMATANAAGYADLKWNRNGNISSTKFVVEKRAGSGAWSLVDIVTATKLRVNVPVGQQTTFRVMARNGQGTSEPSNEATIYGS